MNYSAPLSQTLPQQLNSLLQLPCSEQEFLREVASLCETTPDAPWEVLALIDQSYRRGKLSAELFRATKIMIPQRALGIRKPGTSETQSLGNSRVQVGRTAPSNQKFAAAASSLDVETTAQAGSVDAGAPRARTATPVSQIVLLALLMAVLGWTLPRNQLLANAALSQPLSPVLLPSAAPLAAQPTVAQAPVAVSLHANRQVVFPGTRNAVVTVQRDPKTTGDATLVWWTQSGGAKAGIDYKSKGRRTLTIPAGQASTQLLVPILANPARRHVELFYVRIGTFDSRTVLGAVNRTTVFLVPTHR